MNFFFPLSVFLSKLTMAEVINVDLNRTPRKQKPAVQRRLENSPLPKATTPDAIKLKLEMAEERRSVSFDCSILVFLPTTEPEC